MALTDLLAALERDAEQRIAADRAEATALADRISREAAEGLARRRADAVGREAARLEGLAGREVALATRDAEHAVLSSREHLLERVLELARKRIRAGPMPPEAGAVLVALVEDALGYAGGEAVEVRSTPALAPAVSRAFRGRDQVRVAPDPTVHAGSQLRTADGRLAVDASLEGRLAAREAEARIEILRLLERTP